MPTYGYQCKKCGHQFEVVQSFTAPPIKKCEKCGGPVSKLIFPVGIAFKGSGFHINDYAGSGGQTDAPKTEQAEAPKSEPKAEPEACGPGCCKLTPN
jgi:putative FmdB family regulatory protein